MYVCDNMEIRALGDTAFLIRDENRIHPVINGRIKALYKSFISKNIPGVVDLVPAYCDLKIQYNPDLITHGELYLQIKELIDQPLSVEISEGKVHEVPVVYGGEYGSDLEYVLKITDCSKSQFINLHTNPRYLIFMIGFTPGFPYLGGMDNKIACDRKKTPALDIPAGSVGIAGKQTGIYPVNSPGGWQIIGRTPLKLFCPDSDSPFLLMHGDSLKFHEISTEHFKNFSDA